MFGKKQGTEFKFNLGDEVRDRITGYSGVVFCRVQWLHNCNTYAVKSKELQEGKPMDPVYFDEPSLEVVRQEVMKPKRDTGGPCVSVPQTNRQ